ncbi:MAG: hypothetical protein ACLT5F_09020 [Anaerotignaceae bacterium]
MDEILRTISLKKDEVYELIYSRDYRIDIFNNCDSDIYISFSNEFIVSGNIGNYLTIPSNVAFNNLKLRKSSNKLYIKSQVDGNITVIASID